MEPDIIKETTTKYLKNNSKENIKCYTCNQSATEETIKDWVLKPIHTLKQIKPFSYRRTTEFKYCCLQCRVVDEL